MLLHQPEVDADLAGGAVIDRVTIQPRDDGIGPAQRVVVDLEDGPSRDLAQCELVLVRHEARHAGLAEPPRAGVEEITLRS